MQGPRHSPLDDKGPLPSVVTDSGPESVRARLTALSVVHKEAGLLELNGKLTDAMNPGTDFAWIAVDNGVESPSGLERFEVCPGCPPIDPAYSLDRGSMHHAQGLTKGCREVRTRYLLVIDPDFYVLRAHWVSDVLDHMQEQGLTVFGSCWHPRWWYQYRSFPTVHFMLIDLERLPLAELDFRPGIREDSRYRAIVHAAWLPASIRWLLLLGRLKDTGYRIRRRLISDKGHRHEVLTPHCLRWEDPLLGRLLRGCRLVRDRVTRESFLRTLCPEGYAAGWEEFFWKGQAFAVHLRNVGRASHTSPADLALRRLLDQAPLV